MQLINLMLLLGSGVCSPSNLGVYSGQSLVELPYSQEVVQILKNSHADIWNIDQNKIQARLTPSQLTKLKTKLPLESQVNILLDDVQKLADLYKQQPLIPGRDWFDDFHTYEDTKAWYKNQSIVYPKNVKFVPSIGKTKENNDIFAVHLTNPTYNGKPKKKVWFESLIHAREWITGTTTQYIFDQLLFKSQSDPIIKKILDETEIIFIPIVNPDGYKFTQKERFWRKNRNGSGVDINRNFPFHWGGQGASDNPLDNNYRGPSPGSELETKAIINYYHSQGKIAGVIDFHAYGELILRTWGDTKKDTKDELKIKELGEGLKSKIKHNRGKEYRSIKASELYVTSGNTIDYFYGVGKSFSYGIELSPNSKLGTVGFTPSPTEIKKVGADLLPAVVYFIEFVTSNTIS